MRWFIVSIMSISSYIFALPTREEANNLYKKKNYKEAIIIYTQLYEQNNDTQAILNRAMAYVKLNDYEKAMADLHSVKHKHPKAYYWLAHIFYKNKDLHQAFLHIKIALQSFPDDRNVLNLNNTLKKSLQENHEQDPFINYIIFCEKLNISLEMQKFLQYLSSDYHALQPLLNQMEEKYSYCSLNRFEFPHEIIKLIDTKIDTIATVIVQTLPLYFSQLEHVKKISAIDISSEQIIYFNKTLEAIKNDTLDELINDEIDFIYRNFSRLTKSKKNIKQVFDFLYNPLKAATTSYKIDVKIDDIAKYQQKGSNIAIFLSTLPFLHDGSWDIWNDKIKQWLKDENTVIFSLLLSSFQSMRFEKELDKLKSRITISFHNSDNCPGLIYVVLTPKIYGPEN